MRIDELVWDEWNEGHVAEHGLEAHEVEEVVFDQSSLTFRTKRIAAVRYIILGLTDAGRHVFVVLDPQAGRRAYVITARDMTDGEKRRFRTRGK